MVICWLVRFPYRCVLFRAVEDEIQLPPCFEQTTVLRPHITPSQHDEVGCMVCVVNQLTPSCGVQVVELGSIERTLYDTLHSELKTELRNMQRRTAGVSHAIIP